MKPATRQMIKLALASDETVQGEVARCIEAALAGRLPGDDAPQDSGPLLMTMKDAADFLGVSRVTIWRMVKEQTLRPVEIRRGVFRIRRADLQELSASYASYDPTPRGRFAESEEVAQ